MDGRKNELQNGQMTLLTKSTNVDRYMFVQNYRAVQVKNYYTGRSANWQQPPVTWGTIEKNYQAVESQEDYVPEHHVPERNVPGDYLPEDYVLEASDGEMDSGRRGRVRPKQRLPRVFARNMLAS